MSRRSFSHCNRLPGVTSRFAPQATVPAFIQSSLVPARSGMPREAAIRQMASDMREAAQREGGLTVEGLELLGFTPGQIAELAQPARVMAHKLAAAS